MTTAPQFSLTIAHQFAMTTSPQFSMATNTQFYITPAPLPLYSKFSKFSKATLFSLVLFDLAPWFFMTFKPQFYMTVAPQFSKIITLQLCSTIVSQFSMTTIYKVLWPLPVNCPWPFWSSVLHCHSAPQSYMFTSPKFSPTDAPHSRLS